MKFLFCHRGWLLGLRWIVGAVFLYAGAVKMLNPQDLADSIASFRLLPAALTNGFALSLPPFEVLTGVLLLTGWQRRAAALAVLGMTTLFAVALLAALARGLKVDCGCFGSGQPSALRNWLSLGRDALLFVAALVVYRHDRGNPSSFGS